MKRAGTLTLVLLLLLTVACGRESTSANGPGAPRSTIGPEESPAADPAPSSGGQTTVQVWFSDGGALHPAYRALPHTQAVGRAALEALLAGPSAQEESEGISSAIPSSVELLGLEISDGIATADFTSDVDDGGGSFGMRTRLGQVTFTLTQFPTVKGVLVTLDGDSPEYFSNEGIVIDEPLTRGDFEDMTPPIIVDSPRPGERVDNPVVISGTANVFEATVSIRILDENGDVIKETFTTATCGTGCWGDYSESVKYSVDHEQKGTIEVFESSAEDGSPMHVVTIEVTLTP